MDYTVYRLNLDKSTQRSQAVVKCFKGDTMVKLVCMLTNQGKVLEIDDGNVARLVLTMPSGEKLNHACYIKDNTIVYVFNGDTTREIAESGRIEAQLFVYSGITYDEEGNPIYPNTSIAPRFSIEVAKADESQTDLIYEGINYSVGIVMGAAAEEQARREEEQKRDNAEKERDNAEQIRQGSYTVAETIATEARTTSQRAVSVSSDALTKAQQSNTIANGAKGTADLANIAANEAKGVADDAKKLARDANNAVKSISFDYNPLSGLITLSYKLDENSEPRVFPVDLPVESLITMVSDRKDAEGRVYLDLHLRDGSIKSVLLNDITEGFVKTSTETNSLYATDDNGNAVMVPIEKSSYSNTANAVPRRNALGGLSVSRIPAMDSDATSKHYVDSKTQEKLPANEGSSSHRIWVAAPEGFTDENGDEVKYYLKRIAGYDSTGKNASNGKIGVVTKENRDAKVAEGLISITDGAYENYVEHDEPYPVSVACRDKYGRLVVEDATEDFHAVNKRQLDTKLDKAPTTETYKVYGKAKNGNEYMYPVERGDTPVASEIVRRKDSGQIIVPVEPTANHHAASKAYVDGAVANAGSGSAKLYLHKVTIGSNFGEEEWFDNPNFWFVLTIYRTNNTPITSLSEIKDAEFYSFGSQQFNLWDAPEASRLAYNISKSSDYLYIEYLETVNDYEGVVIGSTSISKINVSIRDTITEV